MDKILLRLKYEALKLNEEYRKAIKLPRKEQKPHIKKTFAEMGDVFNVPFEVWWDSEIQEKKCAHKAYEDIEKLTFQELNLREKVEAGFALFKDDFEKDFDAAKEKLCSWLTSSVPPLVIAINPAYCSSNKEIQNKVKDVVNKHYKPNRGSKRFRPDAVLTLINWLRTNRGLEGIEIEGLRGLPEKLLIDETDFLEISEDLRMLRKGNKIIENALTGDFPGNY